MFVALAENIFFPAREFTERKLTASTIRFCEISKFPARKSASRLRVSPSSSIKNHKQRASLCQRERNLLAHTRAKFGGISFSLQREKKMKKKGKVRERERGNIRSDILGKWKSMAAGRRKRVVNGRGKLPAGVAGI